MRDQVTNCRPSLPRSAKNFARLEAMPVNANAVSAVPDAVDARNA
jgi:hypothetical protein